VRGRDVIQQSGGDVRTFYRIVATDPPTVTDLYSQKELGEPPRDPDDAEALRLWTGVSVYNTEQQARKKAVRLPFLGSFIAELRIPDDGSVRFERTTGSTGHYTLWGDPAHMLLCVASVRPV
jgi:hypothetical protein